MNVDLVHMLAGGIGGTVAALITCPLEVVKVRLQSTNSKIANISEELSKSVSSEPKNANFFSKMFLKSKASGRIGIIGSIKLIVSTEGTMGLFKGVGPNLVGVIPSRSIYFVCYQSSQSYFNEYFTPQSSPVHFFSAAISSFISSTVTNPIWYIKTRLQLDFGAGTKRLTVMQVIRNTYRDKGLRGFYRGVTASYAGISETGLHFMIYENLKVRFLNKLRTDSDDSIDDTSSGPSNTRSQLKSYSETLLCIAASLFSKTFATTLAYPHEVARTRMREEGTKYRGFFQTIHLVFKEEGWPGLYRGLFTHYVRQIPNTCILIGVYELVILSFDRL